MIELYKTINRLANLPPEKIDYILSHFKKITIPKDSYFIKINDNCDHVGFLLEGIIRFYYISKDNQETTCYFAFPNEFITSKYSFNTKKESKEALKAIVDCEIMVIHRNDLEKLYTEIPEAQKVTQYVYDNFSNILMKRIAMLQINSAEERYQYVLENNPALLRNVPLQYVASFLGVTPQHLSRLRKQKVSV
jgi:CRP-like cAMP-binding protein